MQEHSPRGFVAQKEGADQTGNLFFGACADFIAGVVTLYNVHYLLVLLPLNWV
jgi:hypothetical protein